MAESIRDFTLNSFLDASKHLRSFGFTGPRYIANTSLEHGPAGGWTFGFSNIGGGTRKNSSRFDGTVGFSSGYQLAYGLVNPSRSSDAKASKSTTACSTLTSGHEAESSSLMDFSSALTLGGPLSGKPTINLDLSLSIGAPESDVTSVTFGSPPVQTSSEIPAVSSSVIQSVDEGSTSSKWKGSLLPPLIHDADINLNSPNPITIIPSTVSSPAVGHQVTPAVVPIAACATQPRKTAVKTCQYPGCQKGARGASGRCISHGGGRRCQKPGCQKGAEGKTIFCKAHGGGRRCEYLGCTKSAEGRTNLCIAHGGGRRCSFAGGCSRAARGKSGLCIGHGGGKRCKMENCKKSAEGLSGLCIAHGGGRRCQYPSCMKGAQGSTKFCKAHGGGKRCTFIACNKGAEGSTLFCKGHGGGKRCSYAGGCSKSVHGGTLFCVAHGGGKRCAFGGCTKSARGKTNFCVKHGGGKRCVYEECDKSAQGRTDFCKAHGGGRRCLWGHPGMQFGQGDVVVDGAAAPCEKFARGKIGLCAAHSALVQDKRVHGGNGTVGPLLFQPLHLTPPGNGKGKEVMAMNVPHGSGSGEGTSAGWNGYTFRGYQPSSFPMQFTSGQVQGSEHPVREGRVHGGGLMALLRANENIG